MPSEKDMFIQTWEREFQTTLKLLKQYPANKLDLKPAEKPRSAKDLAWVFVLDDEFLVGGAISGELDPSNLPSAPSSLAEIISAYERKHREMVEKVRNTPDAEFNKTMKLLTGPNQMSDVRKGDVFWMGVMDNVHHRGQFSVYMRMAGAKVPSIYGPSADEPWM